MPNEKIITLDNLREFKNKCDDTYSKKGEVDVDWGNINGDIEDQTDLMAKFGSTDTEISNIKAKIPVAASSSNQLADKAFVNDLMATNTATFRGTSPKNLTEQQFLAWANSLTKTPNDYCIWVTIDSNGNQVYKRYKYDGTQWVFELDYNNSSFDQAQWNAINSGINEEKVADIDNNTTARHSHSNKTILDGITANNLTDSTEKATWNGKQDALVSGENIKTINFQDILGSGNIQIATGTTYAEGNGIDIDNNTISVDTTVIATKTDVNAKATKANIVAGTSTKITYNAEGIITGGANLQASDIPELSAGKITDGTFNVARIPTLSISKIEGLQTELQNKQPKLTQGDNITIDSNNRISAEKTEVINDLNSTETGKALSAYQGKILSDKIASLGSIGRFLALWNCATGKPNTDPESLPYTYHTGDYYRIGNVGTTNYIPTGTQYTGTASTTQATESVKVGDIYYFDGTSWYKQASGQDVPVQDVEVDGTSVLSTTDGVARIGVASSSQVGVSKIDSSKGIDIVNKALSIVKALSSDISAKTNDYKPLVSSNVNDIILYGLGAYTGTAFSTAQKTTARQTIGAGVGNGDTTITFVEWE